MLYSYKGIDTEGNEQKGYINAESRVEAMQELKFDKDLKVVFYLIEKVDNPYVNKVRENKDKILEKVEKYAEQQREKQSNKRTLNKLKKEMVNLNSVLQKLKLTDSKEEINPELENVILNIFKDTTLGNINSINYQSEIIDDKPEIRKAKKVKEKREEVKIDWSLIEVNNTTVDKRSKKLKVKESEIILFTKRLALMLRAGLPLVKSLTIIEATVSNNLSIILGSVIEEIQKGFSFSSAIAKFPKQFDTTYVALVLIGESTGKFSKCLDDIVAYKERTAKLQKKVNSATLYPKILGGVLVLVLFAGSKYFIPMFEGMFVDQSIELPALTQTVFAVANVMPQLLIITALLVLGVILSCKLSVNIDRFFKTWISRVFLAIPVVNKMIITSNMYTFSSTVSLMLKNGLRLNEVLKLTTGVISNIHIKNEINAISNYVLQGMPLSEAIEEQYYFDTLLSSIVLTGEESGKLDEALYEISIYYDDILNNTINVMMELIQPVATIVVGVIAVPIILAIYLPIFDMTSGVGI